MHYDSEGIDKLLEAIAALCTYQLPPNISYLTGIDIEYRDTERIKKLLHYLWPLNTIDEDEWDLIFGIRIKDICWENKQFNLLSSHDYTYLFFWDPEDMTSVHPAILEEVCILLDISYPRELVRNFTEAYLGCLQGQTVDSIRYQIKNYELELQLLDISKPLDRRLSAVISYEKKRYEHMLARID